MNGSAFVKYSVAKASEFQLFAPSAHGLGRAVGRYLHFIHPLLHGGSGNKRPVRNRLNLSEACIVAGNILTMNLNVFVGVRPLMFVVQPCGMT